MTDRLSPSSEKKWMDKVRQNYVLSLMALPMILFFLVFAYLPMTGVYYAFTHFDFELGLFKSPFVGLDNFQFLFHSGMLMKLVKNTVLYNLAFILAGNFMQMMCAILISQVPAKWFRKTSQSFIFLPYFISWVLVGAFGYMLFNSDNGVINSLLKQLHLPEYNFYMQQAPWKYIIVFFNVWKGLGYGMIIYLAAILAISDEYYEAARIDGANIYQQIRYITIPLLMPTFIMLVLFSLGGILRGQFDLFYQLIGNNGLLYNATDILDTYVYRSLTVNFDIGMGTAAGLFQSFFGFVLVMIVNFIVRRTREESALF
ncbi:ABC transporter permease [Paenibacillus sp. MMO-177]|uniref:ABC transporter permease n=1 Tax=Paenibacillus sp. MMO-177 TaxID=3081289 RepID=UPI003019DEC8